MSRWLVGSIRGALVVIVVGCLFAQVAIVPVLSAEFAREIPEAAALQIPYAVAAILTLACIQVAVASTWLLLTMVARREIFSGRALRFVDTVVVAAIVATTLVAAVALQLAVQYGGPPGIVIMLTGLALGGVTFTLLTLVLRGLLVNATTLEAELAEVV